MAPSCTIKNQQHKRQMGSINFQIVSPIPTRGPLARETPNSTCWDWDLTSPTSLPLLPLTCRRLAAVSRPKPQPQTVGSRRSWPAEQDLPKTTTFALGAVFYPIPLAWHRVGERQVPVEQKEIQSKVQVNPAWVHKVQQANLYARRNKFKRKCRLTVSCPPREEVCEQGMSLKL